MNKKELNNHLLIKIMQIITLGHHPLTRLITINFILHFVLDFMHLGNKIDMKLSITLELNYLSRIFIEQRQTIHCKKVTEVFENARQ